MKFSKLFPYVHTHTVQEYFALPKDKREKWGIYLTPVALPADFISEEEIGWNAWRDQIRKEYPIQGWLREWFWSFDNPLYKFIQLRIMKLSDIRYAIKRFLKPQGKRWRACWPRHEWRDICTVIVDSNFALIQDFWYDEVQANIVNWESDEPHKQFYEWIKDAMFWIEGAKIQAEKELDEAQNRAFEGRKNKNYHDRYKEVDRLEKYIEETDTKILTEMMKYRGFFWT